MNPIIHDWSDKVILVVEDNHHNFRLLEVALRKTNVAIHWAKNGIEAIEFCRNNNNIDLILMDIQMPVMDGYETTQVIRSFRSDLPILAQTSYSMSGDREKSIEAGCTDYISKPIIITDLLDLINKYLQTNARNI
jgi:two-component system, cell cycle response regulator DivK